MSDPVLDAHREDTLQYIMRGPQPISVRDQILRGALIVQRLREAGQTAADRPLAVVGASAGGARAALIAAGWGVPMILVERGAVGFQTQLLATSNWLNPTQYDWPVDHHHQGRFPWRSMHARLPLPYGSAWARARLDLARFTERSLASPSLEAGLPNWAHGRGYQVLEQAGTGDKALEIKLNDGTAVWAGAAIKARGFGLKRCSLVDGAKKSLYGGTPSGGRTASIGSGLRTTACSFAAQGTAPFGTTSE